MPIVYRRSASSYRWTCSFTLKNPPLKQGYSSLLEPELRAWIRFRFRLGPTDATLVVPVPVPVLPTLNLYVMVPCLGRTPFWRRGCVRCPACCLLHSSTLSWTSTTWVIQISLIRIRMFFVSRIRIQLTNFKDTYVPKHVNRLKHLPTFCP